MIDGDSINYIPIDGEGTLKNVGKEYNLVLFNAPDPVTKEQLANDRLKTSSNIEMDQDVFKKIMARMKGRCYCLMELRL